MIEVLLPEFIIVVSVFSLILAYYFGIARGRSKMKTIISDLTVRKMLEHKRNNFKDL
jgi:hypothetical protein